jgi:hypothetical protein
MKHVNTMANERVWKQSRERKSKESSNSLGEKMECICEVRPGLIAYTVVGIIIIIIKFNSVLYYLCAESTDTRPITDSTVKIQVIILWTNTT